MLTPGGMPQLGYRPNQASSLLVGGALNSLTIKYIWQIAKYLQKL